MKTKRFLCIGKSSDICCVLDTANSAIIFSSIKDILDNKEISIDMWRHIYKPWVDWDYIYTSHSCRLVSNNYPYNYNVCEVPDLRERVHASKWGERHGRRNGWVDFNVVYYDTFCKISGEFPDLTSLCLIYGYNTIYDRIFDIMRDFLYNSFYKLNMNKDYDMSGFNQWMSILA